MHACDNVHVYMHNDKDHEVTENNSHVHTVQHTQVLPAQTTAQTTRKYNLYRHQPDKKKNGNSIITVILTHDTLSVS